MAATTALTTGQLLLLRQLADEGRVYRYKDSYELQSARIVRSALTAATVDALLKAGYVVEEENHGVDRSIYRLSDFGLAKVAEIQHS